MTQRHEWAEDRPMFFAIQSLIQKIRIPRINIEWKTRREIHKEEMLLEQHNLNESIEYYNAVHRHRLQKIQGFDPIYFDKIYESEGGIQVLITMLAEKKTYKTIAKHYGIHKSRVSQIVKAINQAGGIESLFIKPSI
jgi:uncharacterized protein YerC